MVAPGAVRVVAALLVTGCALSTGAPARVPVGAVPAAAPIAPPPLAGSPAGARAWRQVEVDGVRVDLLVDRPAGETLDVLLAFHGTAGRDDRVPAATETTLDAFRALLDRPATMVVSVAYPEEGRLMGDSLREAEAALRWVRGPAAAELGVPLGKVFLAGHSQGGYLVLRLAASHPVDGVVASAPGPIDLVYRCGLEERGEVPASAVCGRLRARFGTTGEAPGPYAARSLIPLAAGPRSDVLLVQGLADSPIQLRSWPLLREQLEACSDCGAIEVLELPGLGHPALFQSASARAAFNAFLDAR